MTQAEEKELVLGNKQLISLFFVVAALCGVFFAMGYMIGRNSAKTTLAAADAGPAASAPVPRQQPAPPPSQDPVAAQPDVTIPAPSDPAASAQTTPAQTTPAVTTRPALDSGALAPKDYAKNTPNVPVPSNAIEVSIPEAGASYLHVTALPRLEADNLIRTLREQSFPVILAESPKDGYYRVLVGPFRQTSQIAAAKNRLKTLGFADAYIQK